MIEVTCLNGQPASSGRYITFLLRRPLPYNILQTIVKFAWKIQINRAESKYIEDICFFEVNTKYISSSELKTSEFSRVRSTSENFYVFNSRDEIYLVFTEKKQIFFLFYTIHRISNSQGRR